MSNNWTKTTTTIYSKDHPFYRYEEKRKPLFKIGDTVIINKLNKSLRGNIEPDEREKLPEGKMFTINKIDTYPEYNIYWFIELKDYGAFEVEISKVEESIVNGEIYI